MNKVLGVYTYQLPSGGWRYMAVMEDGTEQVVRKQATRRYPTAFMYSVPVTSGNKQGLALYFTFGKNPSSWYKDKVVASYSIQEDKPNG